MRMNSIDLCPDNASKISEHVKEVAHTHEGILQPHPRRCSTCFTLLLTHRHNLMATTASPAASPLANLPASMTSGQIS